MTDSSPENILIRYVARYVLAVMRPLSQRAIERRAVEAGIKDLNELTIQFFMKPKFFHILLALLATLTASSQDLSSSMHRAEFPDTKSATFYAPLIFGSSTLWAPDRS